MYNRWRVYSTFLTGICIGLSYALLVGDPWSLAPADTVGPIEWQVLVLAFSGILGGVIYALVINGRVEMPRFIVGKGALFKAGLFGDILLGIAGAFILETLLPSSVSVMEATEFEGSAVAATGIIGGYGGRAIIKFSLERFFKYTGALDEVRAATILEQQQRRYGASTADARAESSASGGDIASGGASTLPQAEDRAESESTLALIERVDRYVQQGLAAPEQAQLVQQLQADSAPVRQAILSAMVELKAEVGDDLDAAQLQRMATIFEGLASVSPNDHALYYQLALAHSAQMPPVYGEALAGLNQAIALRGPLTIGQPWQYELQRAVVNIKQGQATTKDFTLPAAEQENILADLLAIAQVYNLDTILQAADNQQIPVPVVNWIRHNQAVLKSALAEREELRSLLPALHSVLVGNPLRPVGPIPSQPPPSLPPNTSATDAGQNQLDINSGSASPASRPHTSGQKATFPESFSALGRCYDILYLDPFNILLGKDGAKATQIFDFYPQEAHAELDRKETIFIPAGTRYTPGAVGRMEVSSQSSLLYTDSDVQKMFASTLGETAVKLLGAILPFRFSASYASYRRDRSTQKSVYAFTKAEYVHYTLALDRQQSHAWHLNETFRQAVAQLPLTSEYEYFNFIIGFGTHTAIQVDFGGLFHHRYCLTQSSYESMVQSGSDVSAKAKLAFAAKYQKKRQGSTLKEFADSSEVFDFCGGIKKENINDWFGTITANLAPIHLELMPLHELLNSQFFPEDEHIIKKRTLLAAATQSYLEENSEIPWEPWQSTAVGGNEGDTFSDINVSPMHLDATKERYQTARVKEVRVWIKNWVEGVQIVLEGDNIPPPRTHGNEAGDLKILRLAPGDYITAVSVMPGSPQRILVDRGTYVGSIKIQTHKQPDWVVGTPDPNAIALDIPKDYQVIGFHGRSGDRIRKLGVISIPIHHQS